MLPSSFKIQSEREGLLHHKKFLFLALMKGTGVTFLEIHSLSLETELKILVKVNDSHVGDASLSRMFYPPLLTGISSKREELTP